MSILSRKFSESGKILAPASASGVRDLGKEVSLTSPSEQEAFAQIFHDWVQQVLHGYIIQSGWSAPLVGRKAQLPLEKNPLGIEAKKWGVLIVDGVDPTRIFAEGPKSGFSRFLGCKTALGLETVRQRPQFAHVDGLFTRDSDQYAELTGLVAMFGSSEHTGGTFVGWQDDLLLATAASVEQHRTELEQALPTPALEQEMDLDTIIANLKAGRNARKASYELLLRMRMINHQAQMPAPNDLLNRVVAHSIQEVKPLLRLDLSPTRWAFIHEEETDAPCGTAHGRLNATGDHVVMDL